MLGIEPRPSLGMRAVAGLAMVWLTLAGLSHCLCAHAGVRSSAPPPGERAAVGPAGGGALSTDHSCCSANVGSPHQTDPIAPHRGEGRGCEHCRPANGRIENARAAQAGWGTATFRLATDGVQSPAVFASPASLVVQARARTGPIHAPPLFLLTRALRI